MPMKAAVAGIGGGGTILCSYNQLGGKFVVEFYLCDNLSTRRYFLSLHPNPPSSPTTRTTTLPHTRWRSGIFFINQQRPYHLRVRFISKTSDSTQPSSTAAATTADNSIVPDDEFTLAKVSFGVIGLGLGITLLSYGFGASI